MSKVSVSTCGPRVGATPTLPSLVRLPLTVVPWSMAFAPLRLLLVSLEYADPIFSGNGVLARNVAKGLSALGHNILVLSAAPLSSAPTADAAPVLTNGVPTLRVGVPNERHSGWVQFASGVQEYAHIVREFAPDVVIGVDWTSLPVVRTLFGTGGPPFAFLCFRVFATSAELHATKEDAEFYRTMEQQCVVRAAVNIALSRKDEASLRKHMAAAVIHIMPPPLRSDLAAAVVSLPPAPARDYLLCNVRLSPEKNALLFADIASQLCPQLHALSIVPVLVGAAADPAYTTTVRERLRSGCPHALIIEDFLSAVDLLPYYSRAILNFHPALHDAFGMTIIEAAAAGAPSLLADSGAVGAYEFFDPADVFVAPFYDTNATARILLGLLNDRPALQAAAGRARVRALSWTGDAYSHAIEALLREAAQTSLSSACVPGGKGECD